MVLGAGTRAVLDCTKNLNSSACRNDLASVLDVLRCPTTELVLTIRRAKQSCRAFDIVASGNLATRCPCLLQVLIQEPQHALDLSRSYEQLAVINEPLINKATHAVGVSFLLNLDQSITNDNGRLEWTLSQLYFLLCSQMEAEPCNFVFFEIVVQK